MNQKAPERPQNRESNKTPTVPPHNTKTGRNTAPGQPGVSDIPAAPQRRSRAESLAEEERHAGVSTVLFSLTVIAVALFACLVVGVLTVRSALPSGSTKPATTTDANGNNGSATDSGSVLFTPGAVILPNGTSAKTISDISSKYAILVDASTGEILAEKDADVRFSPASMTKVMTLIVACEKLKTTDLNQVVYMTDALREYVTTGNYEGLEVYPLLSGQGARIEDLLYGIGVKSAADCVMMVASYICPAATPAESEAAFVALMNAEAQTMGLTSTHFDNAAGYESDANKSTATEIAAIMMRALQCDLIQKILSTKDVEFTTYVDGGNPKEKCYFISTLFRVGTNDKNTNKTSRQYAYEQAYGKFKLSRLTLSGGKTGTLGDAKTGRIYSLVSFATDGGKTYIVVTGETEKNASVLKDAKTIYDNYCN